MTDELRRTERVSLCCRADVRDRFGLWTGVTEDVSARGCRIYSARQLRHGSTVHITLSSDLFPIELELEGQVVWSSGERLAIAFSERPVRPGAVMPARWLEQAIVHHGTPFSLAEVVPSIRSVRVRRIPSRPRIQPAAATPAPGTSSPESVPLRVPARPV
jgi:hypothetical protein